ncbi:MAG TPA: tautomerase family protein, partial [Paraburkholderia sp.]|uniref:tautomerase family protein n=1 Tax=Paraburkholderia sp. TaxID=1926495 RepID=UPI002B4793B6
MPNIQITMLEGRTPQEKKHLVADVTAAITGALGIKPELVQILITEVKTDNYAVA